jgi:hypothetical protein
VVAVASVWVEVVAGSVAPVHPAAFGEVSVATVGAVASALVEVVAGSVASVAVPDASAAVAGGVAAGGESVAAEAEDGAASVEAGARTSARAIWAKNDAHPRAASSAVLQPRTHSHRWPARTATRFGSTALPSRWRRSCFSLGVSQLTREEQIVQPIREVERYVGSARPGVGTPRPWPGAHRRLHVQLNPASERAAGAM